MEGKEKLVGFLVVVIAGLVALVFGGIYLFRLASELLLTIGIPPILRSENLLFYGAINGTLLGIMWVFGWFSALRVGNAIPASLKFAVLGATVGLYYLVLTTWVPVITKFFTQTLPMASTNIFQGSAVVLITVLAALALVMFVISNVRSSG